MAKIRLKFCTKIGGTIVRMDKIKSTAELISLNIDDFITAFQNKELPLQIVVEQQLLDKLNHDIAVAASSKFYSKVIKVHADNECNYPVILIRAIEPEKITETV